jgi:hypothetical protein
VRRLGCVAMLRRFLFFLGLWFVWVAVVGCGETDRDEVTAVADQFREALLNPAGDPCRFLETALVRAEGGARCERELRSKYGRRVRRAQVRVDRVYDESEIQRASVQIGGMGLELNDSLGAWSIDSVGVFARDLSVSRTQVRPVEWQRAHVNRRSRRLELTYFTGGSSVPARVTLTPTGDRVGATTYELVSIPELGSQSLACASARLPRPWLGRTIVEGTTRRPPTQRSRRYLKRIFGDHQPPCRRVPTVNQN